MFVACHSLCFSKLPLEAALRRMAEMEFSKVDLAVHEEGGHLLPSDVCENLDAAVGRIRRGPSLTCSGLSLDFGPIADPALLKKRFEAACRLAKSLTVAVLTLSASPADSSFDEEVKRLSALSSHAMREGLVLTVRTDRTTLTADPAAALALCQAVTGLGLTLDPSSYVASGHAEKDVDALYPFAQNVLLRDTSKDPVSGFQVRIGQGQIDYSRVVNLLERSRYDRALTVAILDNLDSPFDTEVEVRKLKLLLESLL